MEDMVLIRGKIEGDCYNIEAAYRIFASMKCKAVLWDNSEEFQGYLRREFEKQMARLVYGDLKNKMMELIPEIRVTGNPSMNEKADRILEMFSEMRI